VAAQQPVEGIAVKAEHAGSDEAVAV